MMKLVQNVNTYVEESKQYKADKVKVELDEGTFVVTVVPADVYGVAIAGAMPISSKTCTNLTEGLNYYQDMIRQLEQGDVIRNVR